VEEKREFILNTLIKSFLIFTLIGGVGAYIYYFNEVSSITQAIEIKGEDIICANEISEEFYVPKEGLTKNEANVQYKRKLRINAQNIRQNDLSRLKSLSEKLNQRDFKSVQELENTLGTILAIKKAHEMEVFPEEELTVVEMAIMGKEGLSLEELQSLNLEQFLLENGSQEYFERYYELVVLNNELESDHIEELEALRTPANEVLVTDPDTLIPEKLSP
tara:strand:+ start:550 stop:1206 length:657 start_codon:yes stop_codon:yes gene_type:complete